MGGRRRWRPWSISLSTEQIQEMASQLSHHPDVHHFFRSKVVREQYDQHDRDGNSAFKFKCDRETLRELGEVVAAAHEQPVAQGCRKAVAMALCALPCGNHFSRLVVLVRRNSGTVPFLALLADSNTCVLKELVIRHECHWFSREAEWSLLAHLILRNTTLKALDLQGGLQEMSEKGGIALAHSIRDNRSLEFLSITATEAFGKEAGGLALAAMVRQNSTLRTLQLGTVRLCSRGTEALAKALVANRGLRKLVLRRIVEVGSAIARELSVAGDPGLTLERLELDVDPPAADAIIKLLTPQAADGHAGVTTASSADICRSLQKLGLYVSQRNQDGGNMNGMDASAAADMIRSNRKLVSLTLVCATYSSLEWADSIIPALGSNSTLQELDFEGCEGVDAEQAYNALIRMLSSNTTLHSIGLYGTPLARAGKAEAVEAEVRQNREYRATLAALPKMKVKSCRLVLCGNAFAGKTTLCSTMLKLQPGNRTRFQAVAPQHQPDASTSQQDTQEQERTRGFEVNVLIDDHDLRVALWDFAGQPFYYALHDSVFPNVNGSTIMLFTFSPLKDDVHTLGHLNQLTPQHLKSMQDFEDEFKYWLRFVSSNSRRRPSQPLLPSVVVVITFQDCSADLLASSYREVEFGEKVDQLQAEFEGFVRILGPPEFLDARSDTQVQPFVEKLRKGFVDLVSDLPPVPGVCEKTRLRLKDWASEHNNCPLMSITDFKHVVLEVCAAEIEEPTLSPEEREQMIIFKSLVDKNWKVVALYLHATGEVIYLDGLMDFMVVSPRWLGQGVMGHLVQEFSPFDHLNKQKLKFHDKKQGFVTTKGLEKLLEASLRKVGLPASAVEIDKLILLLCNLHLCYAKKDELDRDGYFIPVLFAVDDKVQLLDRQLQWPAQSEDDQRCLFFGARLKCANIVHTFLTPGFFPRIQVLLHDAGKSKGWEEAGTVIAVHLYGVSTNGYDVLMEYDDANFHIDLLVRSSMDHLSSHRFVYQNFIKPIRSFCASQEGCVGVSLMEGVLRQECVRRRTSSRYRTNQYVSKEELKKRVLNAKGLFYIQQWFTVKDKDGKLDILRDQKEYATLLGKSTITRDEQDGDVDDVTILGSEEEIQIFTRGAKPDVASTIMPFRHISLTTTDVSLWRKGIAKFLKIILGSEEEIQIFTRGAQPDLEDGVRENVRPKDVASRPEPNLGQVEEACYPNSWKQGKRRGLALIVSMEKERPGGAVDRGSLNTLAVGCGFNDVLVLLDQKAPELRESINLVVQKDLLNEDDCFLCSINAHGGTEDSKLYILDENNSKIMVLRDIIEPFQRSEHLRGKPKIFLINCCREGKLYDNSSSVEVDGDAQQLTESLPTHGKERWDCLLVFSTLEGCPSCRDELSGTTFVRQLMQTVMEMKETADVLSMMTMVSNRVNEVHSEIIENPHTKTTAIFHQCCEVTHTLLKKLFWKGT